MSNFIATIWARTTCEFNDQITHTLSNLIIHPSIHPKPYREARANLSCIHMRGRKQSIAALTQEKTSIHTYDWICMSLGCCRKPEHLKKNTEAQGDHVNSTQKGPSQPRGLNSKPPCYKVTVLTTVPMRPFTKSMHNQCCFPPCSVLKFFLKQIQISMYASVI